MYDDIVYSIDSISSGLEQCLVDATPLLVLIPYLAVWNNVLLV